MIINSQRDWRLKEINGFIILNTINLQQVTFKKQQLSITKASFARKIIYLTMIVARIAFYS